MPEDAADCKESITSGQRLDNSRRLDFARRFTISNPKPKAPKPMQTPSAITFVTPKAHKPANVEAPAKKVMTAAAP
jgi:hypothetical protein